MRIETLKLWEDRDDKNDNGKDPFEDGKNPSAKNVSIHDLSSFTCSFQHGV